MSVYGSLMLPLVPMAAWLLLHHLLYDLHWQGPWVSSKKGSSNLILTLHAVTWALFVSVPLYLVGTLSVEQFVFLLATHWGMDWFKGHKMADGERSLVIDQVVHLVTLGAVLWAW